MPPSLCPRAARRTGLTLAGALLAGLAAGCGTAAPPAGGSPATATATAHYPVTVTSCGVPTTYTRPPARAVTNDINTTEDMLALGLESHMAGDFGVTGDGPAAHPVPARYLAGFHRVPNISPGYFTLEKLIGLHPDFVFAGWNYGLQAGSNLTPSYLSRFGIKTLVLAESCVHVRPGKARASIGDTYTDLRNLGAIFAVQRRAQRLIATMKAQIAATHAKIAHLQPVTVFDYDSGQAAPFTAPGLAMLNALIGLAGGTNIFGALKQSWTSVSWEKVIAANPRCIIINDYGTPTAAQKERFLDTSKITKNLAAVKHRCFLTLSYDQVVPSPRNAETVAALARWLHPAAFGLPPPGA